MTGEAGRTTLRFRLWSDVPRLSWHTQRAEVQELPPELLQLLTPVSSRFQGHLHRSQSGDHQIDPFLKIGQRKAVGDNLIHRQQTLFDHPDGYRITSRTQMGAMNVQFLCVTESTVTFSRITLNSTNVPSFRIIRRPCSTAVG
jgi:hypothetical protein